MRPAEKTVSFESTTLTILISVRDPTVNWNQKKTRVGGAVRNDCIVFFSLLHYMSCGDLSHGLNSKSAELSYQTRVFNNGKKDLFTWTTSSKRNDYNEEQETSFPKRPF